MFMSKFIRINDLFGQYSSEINLDVRCSILIGANGVGKSTILNVIKSLFDFDFIELSRYMFDSIELVTENDSYKIEYSDLFPNIIDVLDAFKKVTIQSTYAEHEDGEEISNFSEISNTLVEIDKLSTKNSYQKYLSACLFNKPIDGELLEAINSLTSFMRVHENPAEQIKDTLVSLSTKSNPEDSMFDSYYAPFKHFIKTPISKRRTMKKIHKIITELSTEYVIHFDAVRSFHIGSNLSTVSTVHSKLIDWFAQYNVMFKELSREYLYDEELDKSIIGIPSLPKNLRNECVALVKKELQNPKYERQPTPYDCKKIYLNSFMQQTLVNINALISYFYYDNDFIVKMNDKAIEYYNHYIGNSLLNSGLSEDNITGAFNLFTDDSVLFNVENFISPIILNNFLFSGMVFQISLVKGYFSKNFISPLHVSFCNFYQNEIENFTAYKNPKIETLKFLLEKYLVDKEIIITAAGLRIFKVNKKVKESGPFKLIENFKNEIALDNLSSGEKKIILILIFCIFYEKSILLIDEPELSLSILWQESIIPDILEHTKIKRIIVATHSPFIASNEELFDSIIPLPEEEE